MPPSSPDTPPRRPGRDEPDAGEGEECGQVVAGSQALVSDRLREERDEDRQRAEHERDRGGRGQLHRIADDLVQPDAEGGGEERDPDVPPPDPARPLAREGERGEDEGARTEAKRRVRERSEAVRARVLRGREVEAPEEHGREQEDVRRQAMPHGRGG